MSNLDFKAAVEEMKQAVSYLRASGASKVGAVGFCMGGALTFCAAQHAGIDAAAPFYGTPNPAICQVSGAVGGRWFRGGLLSCEGCCAWARVCVCLGCGCAMCQSAQ